MIKDPYVHHVPTLVGGVGYNGVYNFYTNHFVGKMPKDWKITNVSRTVGKDQVVDEFIISFTHDSEIDYLLPGIAPTGKYVEIPHASIGSAQGHVIGYMRFLYAGTGMGTMKLIIGQTAMAMYKRFQNHRRSDHKMKRYLLLLVDFILRHFIMNIFN